MSFQSTKYIPILGLKPAEMAALEELPEKDKDALLPLIPLKKWSSAANIDKAFKRIEKAFGKRQIIIDLDKEYLASCVRDNSKIENEFLDLFNSEDGYKNWVELFLENPNYIPVLQITDVSSFETQIEAFIKLKRSIVLRLELGSKNEKKYDIDLYIDIIRKLSKKKDVIKDLLIILDYGDFNRNDLLNYYKYRDIVKWLYKHFHTASICISGTSFPYSFSGSYKGELPIYERQIYNKICKSLEEESVKLIYSDRASTRAHKTGGGGQRPPPRIDYPLKDDWRFVRKEDEDYEAIYLYQQACREVINSEYWNKDLRLWGVQSIEETALKDPYGISSAQKATAVRINIHLYVQLHYNDDLSELDTDEDWVD